MPKLKISRNRLVLIGAVLTLISAAVLIFGFSVYGVLDLFDGGPEDLPGRYAPPPPSLPEPSPPLPEPSPPLQPIVPEWGKILLVYAPILAIIVTAIGISATTIFNYRSDRRASREADLRFK